MLSAVGTLTLPTPVVLAEAGQTRRQTVLDGDVVR